MVFKEIRFEGVYRIFLPQNRAAVIAVVRIIKVVFMKLLNAFN